MTEEEAKTKKCPELSNGSIQVSINTSTNANWVNCIASDCMMWIATDDECKPVRSEIYPPVRDKEICKPAGHCGLAK